jgi:hypothetical protein
MAHKTNYSVIWSIIIIFTAFISVITFIELSILLANLKSSGDAFSLIIKDMTKSDYPTMIKNGMLGLAELIGKETNSLRTKLDETQICKINEVYNNDNWELEGKDLTNGKDNNFVRMNTINYHNIYNKCNIELNSLYGSSTSVISDSLIFFSNPNGVIYCYHLYTCTLIWKRDISEILNINSNIVISPKSVPSIFKTSKGIEGIIFGAIGSRKDIINKTTGLTEDSISFTIPCITIALNKFNGNTLFTVQVGTGSNRDYLCEQTASYSIFEDKAISGLNSCNDYFEDNLTFQGSIHAINLNNGQIIWKTFLLDGPLNGYKGGYSGGGITGSNPPILKEHRLVFFSNRHLFNYTQNVYDCLYDNIGESLDLNDYFEYYHICLDEALDRNELILHNSIFAVNIDNGIILWKSQKQLQRNGFGIDARTQSCNNGTLYQKYGNCPLYYPGPGFGYNDQPILTKALNQWRITGFSLGGILYSFDALTGDPRWGQNAAVGSTFGKYGFSYNQNLNLFFITISGTDVLNLQYNSINSPYFMTLSNGDTICGSGLVMSLDSLSGDIIWQSILPYSIVNTCNYNNYSTENFKQFLNFTSIDGNPSLPSNTTTSFNTIPSCEAYQLNIPVNLQSNDYSKIMSNPSTSTYYDSFLLYIPTLYGTVLLLNAFNGQCLGDIYCNYGGVFSSVTISYNHIVFSCGNNNDNNDFYLNNNKTFVYKINI